MTYIKVDPFKNFDVFAKKMNRVAREAEKGFSIETGGFNPRIDILEDDSKIIFIAELAGVKKEDVDISVDADNALTIKGEKANAQSPDTHIRSERSFGSFSRSFVLPEYADVDMISAKFNDGILEIAIQKAQPEAPKEIKVEIS
jgi:HSP20 family protein